MVDSVTISSAPTGPDAPVAQPETAAKAKPQWLPEKFWDNTKGEANYESLAKSYGELEKKQGGKQPEEPKAKTPEQNNEPAKEAAESAGLNFESLQNKYYETGQLEDSDYEALSKIGIRKEMVDNYISGIELQVRQFAENIVSTVGGKEQYAQMTAWAKEAMTQDEITAYNEAVNSGDYHRAVTAVKALKSDFMSAKGSEPSLVTGRQTATEDAYTSWRQVTRDMSNPEYRKDPAFRKTVEEKIRRSKL
jgi:hypothetical protein